MRTKIMGAAALCVVCVTGAAWAQSGPQAQPNRGAQSNQPVNAQAVDIGVAATKLAQPTFEERWEAVPGTTRTGSWILFPKAPSKGPVKMSPRGDVFFGDNGNGSYGFNPSLEAKPQHHVKIELNAKKDRTYSISCHTQMVNKWAIRVMTIPKLTLQRHAPNGAALSANLLKANLSLGTAQTDTTVHMGVYTHTGPDAPVELRLSRAAGNGDDYIFLRRCAFAEETPTTTYRPAQGDKA